MEQENITSRIKTNGIHSSGYGVIPKKLMQFKFGDIKFKQGVGDKKRITTVKGVNIKAVLAYMLSYSGGVNECFPSIKKIADDLEICRSTVLHCTKVLRDLNFITTERLDKVDKRNNNLLYKLNFMDNDNGLLYNRKQSVQQTLAECSTDYINNNTVNNNKNNKYNSKITSKDVNSSNELNKFNKKSIHPEMNNKVINYSDNFLHVLKLWNAAPAPASTHKKMDAKVVKSAYRYYNLLVNGKFVDVNTCLNNSFLDSIKMPKEDRTKKWTHDEIVEGISNALLQYEDGYWPYDRKDKERLLPKNLKDLFYNSYAKGCPSIFLKCYYTPPKYFEDNVKLKKDNYEDLTCKYYDLLGGADNIKIKVKNSLIDHVKNLVEWHDGICEFDHTYKDVKFHYSEVASSVFRHSFGCIGYEDKLVDTHIEWLKENFGDDKLNSNNVKAICFDGWGWDKFKVYLDNDLGIKLNPDDGYLESLYLEMEYIKQTYWKK